MKRGILVILLFLLMTSLVSAAKVDKTVEEELENQEEVSVIIKLKEKPLERL